MEDLSQCNILVVDDTRSNIDLLVAALKDHYRLSVATNGENALKIARAKRPDLILLDVMMPEMDGFEVCTRLKAEEESRDIPIIFLTALDDPEKKSLAFRAGAVDYITKPFYAEEVKARVRTHLSLMMARRSLTNQNCILEERVRERTAELERNIRETLLRLGLAAELRDNDTGMHIRRIKEYTVLLATRYGLDEKQAHDIGLAATMHDIGKIGIPDGVLLKPGKLDQDEWSTMKSHVRIGAAILENPTSALLELSRVIALSHHERWDGRGYPNGLKGEAIPLPGRIVGLVDVFDALTSERPYKRAWTVDKAIAMILSERGSHFDPDLVDVFEANLNEFKAIREQLADGGELDISATRTLLEELLGDAKDAQPVSGGELPMCRAGCCSENA